MTSAQAVFKVVGVAFAGWLATPCGGQTLRGAGGKRDMSAEVLVDNGGSLILPTGDEEIYGAKYVNKDEADATLIAELSGAGEARIQETMEEMKPLFEAWPKDSNGRIDHQTARYVLHRWFVQRHTWYLKGLEPNGDTWQQNASPESLRELVPEDLLNRMEERVGRHSFELHDVATLVATIEDLVNKEADGSLRAVYGALELDVNKATRDEVRRAIDVYLVMYFGQGLWELKNANSLAQDFAMKHDYWDAAQKWSMEIEARHLGTTEGSALVDFSKAADIVREVGASYGAYNNIECQKLKEGLLSTWSKGRSTGRARLVDFYKLGLQAEEFSLNEKASYLRAIGALDESNASVPMVVIPNYLSAKPNCLQSTSLYSVCCRNQCEDLMSQIERSIAAPTATAEQLVTLVGNLRLSVAAPRISESLRARLDDIAALHGGEVNLHGRLFAQWMHHAFPTECPFPHESGTSDPVTPDAWQAEDTAASEEERKQYVADDTCGPEQAAADWDGALPWSETEELLSGAAVTNGQRVSWSRAAMLIIFAFGLALAARAAPRQERQKFLVLAKHRRHWVLLIILLVAFVTNVVDRSLIVFVAGTGVAFQLTASKWGAPGKILVQEKSFV